MRIGIDIRTLMDVRYSGVAEYVLHLLHAIFKAEKQEQDCLGLNGGLGTSKQNQYFLFYNSAHDLSATMPKFDYPNVKLVGRRYPNKLLNYGLLKLFNIPKTNNLFQEDLDIFLMPHLNFIALESETKNILTIHDLSFLRYPKFFSWRQNIWHRLINVKKLVKKFDKIIAISESTKQDLIELCNVPAEKIKVILSAIDDEYCQLEKTDQQMLAVKSKLNLPDRFILHLGTVEPRKNIESLIAGYNDFRKNNPEAENIKLVIAGGRGWKSEKIYQAVQSSDYHQDIILTGYVDDKDKVALYNLAEVLVYPSFYEGFGFPPLEAMACGTPVICSFSSSLPEVVNDAAILIDPYNSTQISQALEAILFDQKLRDYLILQGKEQSKQFSWERVAEDYLRMFSD